MSRTVLQIDDEPGMLAAVHVRLRAAGFEVIAATDGAGGLDAAASRHPDVILLDIRMPGMDGFEVCRRLKADAATAAIPVIFLSANAPGHARSEAMQACAVAYLSKPYESAELLKTIESVLDRRAPSQPTVKPKERPRCLRQPPC